MRNENLRLPIDLINALAAAGRSHCRKLAQVIGALRRIFRMSSAAASAKIELIYGVADSGRLTQRILHESCGIYTCAKT